MKKWCISNKINTTMTAQEINSISTNAKFGDKRLNLRFEKILKTLSKQVECSIPQAFKQWGQTKAMYRFLSNKKVNEEIILASHLSSWIDRVKIILMC